MINRARSQSEPLALAEFTLTYADTDPAGILYYAAWFPRMESLQSQWFLDQGMRQDRLLSSHGFWTVTCHTECDYLVPAKLFDRVRAELRLGRIGRKSFDMEFQFVRTADEIVLGLGAIRLVTVTPSGNSVDIPDILMAHLRKWSRSTG